VIRQLHAIVQGKVQGVWFRAWTRDTAREMGVTGWVRNLPDGTVETLAQGDETLLTSFVQRLWDGPPLARVTDIETEWSDADEPPVGFQVRR